MDGDVPTMIRSDLADIIWHKRHLIGTSILDEAHEIGVGIAFDIIFGVGKFVADYVRKNRHIGFANMPLIGPRMDGEAAGPSLERDPAKMFDARPRQVAAVAQESD